MTELDFVIEEIQLRKPSGKLPLEHRLNRLLREKKFTRRQLGQYLNARSDEDKMSLNDLLTQGLRDGTVVYQKVGKKTVFFRKPDETEV